MHAIRFINRSMGWVRLLVIVLLMSGWILVSQPVAHAASITVTTTADELNKDGDCSLREAIRAASSNTAVDTCAAGGDSDTITLPAGTYMLRIPQGSSDRATGDLDISGKLTIRGAGSGSTTVDGGGLDRVFDIWSGATVVLEGMTIRGGLVTNARYGGGILNNGTLTLRRSVVTANTAKAGDNYGENASGGGIYSHGTLTIEQSTISGNHAEAGEDFPAGSGYGGGIASLGTLTISSSDISGNQTYSGGDESGGPAYGGGVWSKGTLTIKDSVISSNNSAAYGSGGGVFTTGGSATISRTTISGNSAGSDGGGLYNEGTLTISASTFNGNRTNGGPHGIPTHGGAIANFGGKLTATNVTISGNSTVGNGGGVYNTGTGSVTLNNVTVAYNVVDRWGEDYGDGGGLFNDSYDAGGRISLRNTIVANNSDTSGQAPDCGGQLTSQGYNLIRNRTGCTLMGSTTGNTTRDPKLGPLQNNGGRTTTHVLLSGSGAIDAANPNWPGSGGYACATTDQRGYTRPKDGNGDGTRRCDIGAFERQTASSTTTSTGSESDLVNPPDPNSAPVITDTLDPVSEPDATDLPEPTNASALAEPPDPTTVSNLTAPSTTGNAVYQVHLPYVANR